MRRRTFIAVSLATIALRARAQDSGPDVSKPQPELPKEKLTIITRDGVRHEFDVEIAASEPEQVVGLMWRKSLPPDGGMLFDWKTPRRSMMWMRNTLVPLDMIFIKEDGTVGAIAENTVPRSLAVIDSRVPVRATLEVAAGTAAKDSIRVGDKVESPIFTGQG
jgi:uncharacterized protein